MKIKNYKHTPNKISYTDVEFEIETAEETKK